MSYAHLGGGLYRDTRTGNLYERPFIDGRQTFRKLNSGTVREARAEAESRRELRGSGSSTVAAMLGFYLRHDCPRRNGETREGAALKAEVSMVKNLARFFKERPAHSVTLDDCYEYHKWRKSVAKRGGDRMVDIELCCLSNAFRFAMRNSKRTGVTANPIAHERERFRKSSSVVHCREWQPRSGDDLHAIMGRLMSVERNEVFGWLGLLQSMIGHRISKMLLLRADAKSPRDPGFISDGVLYLPQSSNHKGTRAFIRIHPALQQSLDSYFEWRKRREIESPFYFPSNRTGGAVTSGVLTRRLDAACRSLKLPACKSHGLRSFFANALRSLDWSDQEVAVQMGHTSTRELIQVYGEAMPHKIDWMPKSLDPAWTQIRYESSTLISSRAPVEPVKPNKP